MSPSARVPTILCILDGWGIAPVSQINGITAAYTPAWNYILNTYPHAELQASELYVGLPPGQMGNSEVGHMTIGAGRVVLQDLPRIDQSLQNGTLESNPQFLEFISQLKKTGGTCHLLGLLSPGGVHSHQSHIESIVHLLFKHKIPVNIHAILDGRDTPPQSAYTYLQEFFAKTNHTLSTIGGRYYAMDRDKRWDRIEKAYRCLTFGEGPRTQDPLALLKDLYNQGIGDEFIHPHCVNDYAGIMDGDGLFMLNFRADRVRQILSALLLPNFKDFDRGTPPRFSATLAMGDYAAELTPFIPALFPKEQATSPLGAVVAAAGLNQLRIAETEKYAHVTFFLNGGREEVFPGEDRVMIPSPDVATYDLKPEMSAKEVTDKVVEAITTKCADHPYSLIVINYANTDMVGHTGIQEAIVKAVETIDHCLSRLEVAAKDAGYALIITADHGNVEQMINETTGEVHTAHTCNPVPFVLINGPKSITHVANGQLSDIAPTILTLLDLPIPEDMTGKSLLKERAGHDVA
ncbi:MAG: 2,3-bisphosphoglycerate-independent phosphoglycerate mutase [Alphaproteobacteria bacterium]|nr:2,3-bisphosphoglycerate-independent phosphoglycerate mutase [Alphaproteobacteria bacterium]